MYCNKCGRFYEDMFDTTIRIDYTEPGKGKPYEYHICMKCRKELINQFKWS